MQVFGPRRDHIRAVFPYYPQEYKYGCRESHIYVCRQCASTNWYFINLSWLLVSFGSKSTSNTNSCCLPLWLTQEFWCLGCTMIRKMKMDSFTSFTVGRTPSDARTCSALCLRLLNCTYNMIMFYMALF